MGIQLTKRQKSKYRIRKKINGTSTRPRLSVFRSNSEIYCQLIDDTASESGKTLCAASSKESKASGTKTEVAKAVGKLIASKATGLNIQEVVFDRNGFLYHGRVKALADSARESGLKF
ncbi:MAG: 50S ribosomal protein L18 [Saprospiraceae bacterium]|nr:50S ribosomal protein L18 [Saprospiraceae bacterium]